MTAPLPAHKARLAASFSAAADGYAASAHVQGDVAEALARWVAECAPPGAPRVLEVGCGTGLLTERLLARLPGCDYLATDLAPGMVAHCAARVRDARLRCAVLDAESRDVPRARFELVVTSLAAQWFEDLPGTLERLTRALVPGGQLFLATLGAENFPEWRRAHAARGLPVNAPPYPTRAAFPWPQGGAAELHEAHVPAHFPDGRAFVRSLQAIGAQLPAPGYRPLPAGTFRQLLRGLGAGFTCTYHVLYGRFRRA